MEEHILKRHDKNLLMYHLVCPAKYRKKIFTEDVENTLKEICIEIGNRYEIKFLEIGIDEDHVYVTKCTNYGSSKNSNNNKKYNSKRNI